MNPDAHSPGIGDDTADYWIAACDEVCSSTAVFVRVFSNCIILKEKSLHILTYFDLPTGGSFLSSTNLSKYFWVFLANGSSWHTDSQMSNLQRCQYLALARIRSANSKALYAEAEWGDDGDMPHDIAFHHFRIISFTDRLLDVQSVKMEMIQNWHFKLYQGIYAVSRSRLWTWARLAQSTATFQVQGMCSTTVSIRPVDFHRISPRIHQPTRIQQLPLRLTCRAMRRAAVSCRWGRRPIEFTVGQCPRQSLSGNSFGWF